MPAYLALSCVGAFTSFPAFAEAAPPPAVGDADEAHNDIIVNGQREQRPADPKQVAPLLDTPKSIVVLSKDTIEQTASNSLQDALRTVPGITFAAAEGGNPIGDRPFIRGFDAQGSIFVDGVRDLASQSREVFAIDSVQIVRGSDSTLGGRGSAGGTIDILSKVPQASTFGSVSATYGNGDYKRATADLNVKISDIAAFRIEGVYHDQSVVGRDAIFNNRWGVAPSFTLGLGTPTRLMVGYYYLKSHELPDTGLPFLNICSTVNCNLPAGNVFSTPALGTVTTRGGQTGFVSRDTFYGLKNRDFRDTTTSQATLRVEHDFGGITLRNTARYSNDDQAYIYTQPDDSQGNVFGTTTTNTGANLTSGGYAWRRANTRYGYVKTLIDQLDLSGTFNTGSVKHSFAAGAEFSWEKARRGTFVTRGYLNAAGVEILSTGSTITPRCTTASVARYYCTSAFNPNPNDPYVNYASDTSNVPSPIVRSVANEETQNDASTVAFYGFDSITIVPQLILNVGARYDRFKSVLTPGGTYAAAAGYTLSRTDELFNWQAGLVFKPTKDTSIYASYATAATPPNSLLGEGREDNALPTTNTAANLALLDSLKVQKTKSYEVGAKASVLNEKLSLAVAAFQTDIDNARVTTDANTVAFIGKTRIRGIELTATGNIARGWAVFGGYTYLDPKVVDGGFTALAVAANGVGAPATTVQVSSVNTGKQVPQIARHSFTATTSYEIIKGLQIGGSALYTSRVYGGYADNRVATQTTAGVVTVTPATVRFARGIPDYWRFDVRASYQLNRNLQLSVNVQNLTDKVYFSQTFTNHYATVAPGRTVLGSVNFKF